MSFPGKPERNAAIVQAYRDGATMADVAKQFGLSLSRISYIVLDAGARLSREEWSARHGETSRRTGRDPEVRARISATISERWANGHWAGRRKIFGDDPARRDDYIALRTVYGAAYAREAMGIATSKAAA